MARRRPPSGVAVLRKLRDKLGKGWPPGLTVLTGEDLFHLDAAQKALLDHLVPEDSSDFALTVVGEGRLDTADLVAAAQSRPMFAARRVVLVREVGILDGKPEPLATFAGKPPAHAHLIVRAPKLDLRRPLHKLLHDGGQTLEFGVPRDPGGADTAREVRELAAERGLKPDRAAVAFLLEACAGDLYRVCSELDKLDVWIAPGKDRPVDLATMRDVAVGGGALSGWEVADAICLRDRPAALEAVRRLVDAGEEPLRILGGLAWRARVLVQAKAAREKGARDDQLVAAARAWFFRDRFMAGLSRYSLPELARFPARLLGADRALKSRTLDSLAILESLVEDLTRPAEESS